VTPSRRNRSSTSLCHWLPNLDNRSTNIFLVGPFYFIFAGHGSNSGVFFIAVRDASTDSSCLEGQSSCR